MKRVVYVFLLSLFTGIWGLADRPMEPQEVDLLLEQLSKAPTGGWIQQGRIEAIHHASDYGSGQTIETVESVITDSVRFAWTIRITSDAKTLKLKDQDTHDFLEWNRDRTFVWDGLTYTLYFRPGNHALVYENPTSVPVNVNGPLTAGHIPWGQGVFRSENPTSKMTGIWIQTKDGFQIHLGLVLEDHSHIALVLDPARGNAILSYTLIRPEGSRVVHTYDHHIQHQGRFIPTLMLIDRYDAAGLQTSDLWEITALDSTPPTEDHFTVAFDEKALVESYSSVLDKPVFYRYSRSRDIKPLFEKRLMTGLKKHLYPQNCGTAAVETILSAYDMAVNDTELEFLVDADSGQTSLYQIQEIFQKKGLFCLPVKTTLDGLGRFREAQVVLYFPHKKHFVVLDRMEKKDVWVVDLDRQTFYYSMDREAFLQSWAGIALVVSTQPLYPAGQEKTIPEPVSKRIVGAADYSCGILVQEYDVNFCPGIVMGQCNGRYTLWYDRYLCQAETTGGFCEGTGVISSIYSSCTANPDYTGCTMSGNYIARYLRSCLP